MKSAHSTMPGKHASGVRAPYAVTSPLRAGPKWNFESITLSLKSAVSLTTSASAAAVHDRTKRRQLQDVDVCWDVTGVDFDEVDPSTASRKPRRTSSATRSRKTANAPPQKGTHPRLHRASIDAMRAQLENLDRELEAYEALQRGTKQLSTRQDGVTWGTTKGRQPRNLDQSGAPGQN